MVMSMDRMTKMNQRAPKEDLVETLKARRDVSFLTWRFRTKVLEIDGDEYGQDDETNQRVMKDERIRFKAKVFDMNSNDIADSQYAQRDVVDPESDEDERGYISGRKL